jgi:HEAT repeat protein
MMRAMPHPPENGPKEGDELWFGLVGPIRVSDEITYERQQWIDASRVAQAAQSLDDLTRLVTSHPDFRVRYEAIPRLRARFPDDQQAFEALAAASTDSDAAVRDAALMALQWIARPEAADAIAARLTDSDFDVRLTAAQSLAFLGDERAPADPEAWALEGLVGPGKDQ